MKDYIAILTGGGYVPCFHSAMLGITETAEKNGLGVIGFKDGFKGANSGAYYVLTSKFIKEYADRGGSVIGSSREKSNPKMVKEVLARFREKGMNIKGIIGMAGDDHLGQLHRLYSEEKIPVVGWPKTMDNDLSETYHTLGYLTAAMNAAKSIRQAQDGAWTGSRVHIVTMFGRDTDWVVAAAGAWGAADLIVGGESGTARIYDIKEIYEKAKAAVERNQKQYGRKFAVIAVAEGASITGIESHIDESAKDIHGNPKLVPQKLALAIQAGFKKLDEKMATSIDSLTYDTLRNCQPIESDKIRAHQAGAMCAEKVIAGEFDVCVVIEEGAKGTMKTMPLAKVAVKRFMAPLGFMDYENMQPTQAFIDYYTPLFGKPLKREEVLFKKPEEGSL